jgi:hypothetical protein
MEASIQRTHMRHCYTEPGRYKTGTIKGNRDANTIKLNDPEIIHDTYRHHLTLFKVIITYNSVLIFLPVGLIVLMNSLSMLLLVLSPELQKSLTSLLF